MLFLAVGHENSDPHAAAPELVALVRAGAKFVNGRLVERADQEDAA